MCSGIAPNQKYKSLRRVLDDSWTILPDSQTGENKYYKMIDVPEVEHNNHWQSAKDECQSLNKWSKLAEFTGEDYPKLHYLFCEEGAEDGNGTANCSKENSTIIFTGGVRYTYSDPPFTYWEYSASIMDQELDDNAYISMYEERWISDYNDYGYQEYNPGNCLVMCDEFSDKLCSFPCHGGEDRFENDFKALCMVEFLPRGVEQAYASGF